jgi:H+-translocating NAD(P) transhydrogenase
LSVLSISAPHLCNRLAAGYAGVENPLFIMPQTSMLLGDAKDTVEKLGAGIKDFYGK